METKIHHGKAVIEIAKMKGFNKSDLANAAEMSRQGLEYHLKRPFWNQQTLEQFAKILKVDASEITNKISSNQDDYKSKYFQLLETTNQLWRVLNENGIKVELSNFNLGVLIPTYDHFFLTNFGHKITHP
ncbi:hypothetical protein [Emticicia sp. 17c]|uniref:hypothetical protein n=1 Tax=Emticicia sp. 17c TaxID=3127704 RepID=UPI00301D4813